MVGSGLSWKEFLVTGPCSILIEDPCSRVYSMVSQRGRSYNLGGRWVGDFFKLSWFSKFLGEKTLHFKYKIYGPN